MQEIPSGEGTLLLVTANPDPSWTDLPTRGLWLPLVYRSLLYLASGDAAQGAQLSPGQSASLAIPGAERYAVVGPDGAERAADVRIGAAGPRLETGGLTDRPGVYTVQADGDVATRFAVGLDPRESLLESTSASEASANVTAVTGLNVETESGSRSDAQEAQAALGLGSGGREIWNVLLWLSLLFLLAETIVARRWRPEGTST